MNKQGISKMTKSHQDYEWSIIVKVNRDKQREKMRSRVSAHKGTWVFGVGKSREGEKRVYE